MPNPALTAVLGIDPSSFLKGITASESSLKELERAVKLSAAEVAAFEQSLKGSGSSEQLAQLDALKGRHRDLQIELKNTARQMAAFQAASDLAPKANGPKAPDESERYDAHWKGLEEKERSKRAADAIRASQEASDAAEADRRARIKKFQNERAALVRELKEREENERDASHPSGGPASGEGGAEKSDGSNRMRNQELAHSARAFTDMMFSGISPLRALEMEGPRLVQAFGGGLGAILGIGTAVAGMAALVNKTVELTQEANELHRASRTAINGDTTQGQQSVDAIQRRIQELDEVIAKDAPASGAISRIGKKAGDWLAALGQATGSAANALFGDGPVAIHAPGEQRKNDTAKAEDKRAEKLQQIVNAETEINDLKEQGFHLGQDQVRLAELELQRKNAIADVEAKFGIPKLREQLAQAETPEQKDRAKKDLDDKESAVKGLVDQLNREFDLKVNVAQIDVDRGALNRWHATLQAELGHVGMYNADGTGNPVNLPNGFARNNIALQKRLGERDRAAAILEATEKQGGDTRAARQDVSQAEAALLDSAIEEALKTPEQRRKDADTLRNRQQAEGRLAHPGTMDADRGESRVHDADLDGSVIPDASNHGPNKTRSHEHEVPRGIHGASSLAEQVRRSSENAGKGDHWKGENVVTAVKEVTGAVNKISFANR